MRTYWLTGEDPAKSRRNSETEESPRSNILLHNNNCTECICECGGDEPGKYTSSKLAFSSRQKLNHVFVSCPIFHAGQTICPVNGLSIGDHPNHLLNMRLYKPTTWLLAECNNEKLVCKYTTIPNSTRFQTLLPIPRLLFNKNGTLSIYINPLIFFRRTALKRRLVSVVGTLVAPMYFKNARQVLLRNSRKGAFHQIRPTDFVPLQ